LLNKPVPKFLADAPELEEHLGLYFTAFHDLNTCRSFGMGPGPVPWLATVTYARHYRFSDEQTEDLIYFVQRMDDVYLHYVSEQVKKK
jgi:hypothetical protein